MTKSKAARRVSHLCTRLGQVGLVAGSMETTLHTDSVLAAVVVNNSFAMDPRGVAHARPLEGYRTDGWDSPRTILPTWPSLVAWSNSSW